MLVCVSCNIEFKEDKKFCSYCGGSLVTKEDLGPNRKGPEKEEDKSKQKLICPHCRTIYDFGSSCIQCGSDLVAETFPEGKEKPLRPDEPRGRQIKKPREGLICPTCKVIYEGGNFCPKCGSPLAPQTLTQALKEAKATLKPEEEPIQSQRIREQLIEAPRKNFICPHCKIIYERGNTCVRCGAALVAEVTAQAVGAPEPPSARENAFDPGTPHKSLTGPVQASEPTIHSPSSPQKGEAAPARDGLQRQAARVDRQEPDLFSDIEIDKASGASKQDPTTSSADNLERRPLRAKKRKIDYRRLFIEIGSISIMILAGGYLLWSIYSHVTNLPEPKASRPKEVSAPPDPSPPNPLHATTKVPVPQESEKEEAGQRAVLPKEPDVAHPSPPSSISSDALVLEALETTKIKDLLENIRRANLQKDIDLFVSCYAIDFKDRDGKKKATLSFWKKFDYLELSYDLKRTSITGDTARVKIEWVMKISSKAGGPPQESKTFLDAVLKKEEGNWKIQEVKQAG
jgi:RNA polymerase subunit RPABC4/transcription elongation factor Spt4/ketosteroid isomerase-like protein